MFLCQGHDYTRCEVRQRNKEYARLKHCERVVTTEGSIGSVVLLEGVA